MKLLQYLISILIRVPLASSKELGNVMQGRVYLCSHGGVSSEAVTKLLGITYPDVKFRTRPFKERPLRGVLVHYPKPIDSGPRMGVYLYGDPIHAIISQFSRHPDNSKKLHNNELYPVIHSINELLSLPGKDPFGMRDQFSTFCHHSINYPLVMVNRKTLTKNIAKVSELIGNAQHCGWVEKNRASNIEHLDKHSLNKVKSLYGDLDRVMSIMPDLVIRYPGKSKSNNDFHHSDVLRISPHVNLLPYVKELLYQSGVDKDDGEVRFKHALLIEKKADGSVVWCVNIRRDYLSDDNSRCVGDIAFLNINAKGDLDGDKSYLLPKEKFDNNMSHSGPEDQRYFSFEGKNYLIFNAPCEAEGGARRIYLYDIAKRNIIKFFTADWKLDNIEKNWMSVIKSDGLYIIYSLNPMVVFKCVDIDSGKLEIVKKDTFGSRVSKPKYPWGGTNLIPWLPPYYIGFAHTNDPWRAALMVIDADKWKMVGLGEPIDFKQPDEAIPWRGKSVQYPYHLDVSGGQCHLWLEFEDRCSTDIELNFETFCQSVSDIIR